MKSIFPFTDTGQLWEGSLPALVVQNDRDNQKIRKTVIAMITANLRRQTDPSHLLIDPRDPTGAFVRTQSDVSPSFMLQSLHDRTGQYSPRNRPHIGRLEGKTCRLSEGGKLDLFPDLKRTL